MKIRQLHINRFGHFSECDLAFPGDGLQVVYGPNEAGKTTLLEFLRGLLFDFPARTPYDFGGQGEMAGVAALELRDGRAVELRRRKGNKDKVSIKLNGQPTELDDAGWLRLLDHADRGLFESVFAFGLDQLSQGELSLKHESLQSALFGGSLGGTSSPDKIVAELSRQADELFKKGGRTNPRINVLLSELSTLKKTIKDRSLRPEKFHAAESAAVTAAANARKQHDQVAQLRREHAKIEKRLRAWPKWWELRQRRDERAGLCVPENVPADARQRHLTSSRELKSLADAQALLTNEIKQAESSLAALQLDPGAVSYRAEIKACLELRQSFIEARDQLPERQRHREATRLQIDRELAELRAGWSHDELRNFTVDVATRAEIDRLIDDHSARFTAHTRLTTRRDSDATQVDRLRDELAEIGEPRDVTSLAAVLGDEAEFVANRNQLENSRGELKKLERKLATQCRKLTPPMAAATRAPHQMAVPRAESIAEFERLFGDVREQLRSASASAEEDEAEQRALDKSLSAAMSRHVVPSLDERDTARGRRDSGWKLIRQKYIAAEQADSAIDAWLGGQSAKSLPDGYEQAVDHADQIADQIYGNANEVAEREGLRRQLVGLAARLVQKRLRLTELQRQQAEMQTQWLALWEPCGFEPLAPEAMLGWLNDHAAVCATITQLEECRDEQSQLAERLASFGRRLCAACGVADGDASAQMAAARQTVDEAKDQQRRTSELQKEIRRLDRQLAKSAEELQSLATRESAANCDRQAVLGRLKLPDDWSVELAREVIDKLSVTRVRLDSLPEDDSRIEAMQKRIAEFQQRVRALCVALAPELLRDLPELAIDKLAEQVERAIEAQRKQDDLSQQLAAAREQLRLLDERQLQQDSERAGLFSLARAATETAFLEVVTRAEKVVQLEGEITQLQREVDLIRAGDDREEFEQSLAASELVVLQGRELDLREELQATELSRKTADGDEALARDALVRLDGSGDVAALTEELSRKRSQLAADVDRYMPLIYARHLLNAAVTRFEKQNQPEMIATVSRLLGLMTGGKYIEFDRSGGGRQNILIRRADGVERTPDQLSTGTREQLYLAIRLAYVLHYCETNQPLPIIIDDVLVNFDDARTRQTLAALADISQTAQVLFFTCHPHMVTLARDAVPGLNPINI